jgi:hypothetical protein
LIPPRFGSFPQPADYRGLWAKRVGRRDRSYFKSLYLLDGTVIEDIVTRLDTRPSGMTYTSIWKFGGAVARVPSDATAFGNRSMPYMPSIDAMWSKPEDDAANIAWSRSFCSDMQRHSDSWLYLSFAGP